MSGYPHSLNDSVSVVPRSLAHDSTMVRGILALLGGVSAVPAFAPLGWYPLAIGALALLFWVWHRDRPRAALLHGWLFGVGYFGAGVSWVYVSIHDYGKVDPVAALGVTLLLIAYLSVFPAVLGYAVARLIPAGWQRLLLAYPAGWVFVEWARGWLFTGFPWLTIGYSQIDGPLAGLAPVLGVYGVDWAVAFSAAIVTALIVRCLHPAGALMLLLLWGGGLVLRDIDWTQSRGEVLRVALLQGNISQELKWEPENLVSSVQRYIDLTRASPGNDLVVWPETAVAAFYHQVEDSVLVLLEEEAESLHTELMVGIPVLDRAQWRYYNSIMTVPGRGAFYHKRHLVPFGEYLPLRALIGNSLDALAVPNADFSAGEPDQPLLRAAGYPVGTSICYEIVFGEEIIRSLPEAAFLVNISNDAWFGDSLAPHQHLEMARMRARETGRYLLRATNTGITAIIAPDGGVTGRTRQFAVASLEGTIEPRKGATPYVRFGNRPVVAGAVLVLLLGYVLTRQGAETGKGEWRRAG
jgi:apolipoprotein N-acyltransferase